MTNERRARQRAYSRKRRATNRAAGKCITNANHGEATHGVLCKRCRETHRGTR